MPTSHIFTLAAPILAKHPIQTNTPKSWQITPYPTFICSVILTACSGWSPSVTRGMI